MSKSRLSLFLWLAALVVVLFPLLFVPILVTQDGGVHLYNAFVLSDWSANASFYTSFYTINTQFSPNWFAELLLSALFLCFDAVYAEKIVQALIVLSLPLGLRYAITALHQAGSLWSLAVLPLCYNFVFFYGFYNFCLSLSLALFAIGVIWRQPERLNWRNILGLNLLFLSVYGTHPVAWLVVVFVFLSRFTQHAFAVNRPRHYARLTLLSAALVLAPTFGFFYAFSTQNSLHFIENKLHFPLFQWLFLWQSGAVFDDKERIFFAIFGSVISILFFSALYLSLRRAPLRIYFAQHLHLFLPVVGMLFLYLFAPDFTAGGGYLTIRMSYFLLFFIIIYLSSLEKYLHFSPYIAIFSIVTSAGIHYHRFENMQKASALAESVSDIAAFIPPKSVVLPLNTQNSGAFIADFRPKIYLFKHLFTRLGAKKALILLDNYEANTNYFPLMWLANKNPYTHLGTRNCIEDDMKAIDILPYEHRLAPQKIDFAITFSPSYDSSTLDNTILAPFFEPIKIPTKSLIRLFKRKIN